MQKRQLVCERKRVKLGWKKQLKASGLQERGYLHCSSSLLGITRPVVVRQMGIYSTVQNAQVYWTSLTSLPEKALLSLGWPDFALIIPGFLFLLFCRGCIGGWNSLCRVVNSISILCFVSVARLFYFTISLGVSNKWHKILEDCFFRICFLLPVFPTVSLAVSILHHYNLKIIIPNSISSQNFCCERNSAVFLQCNCLP